MFFKVKYWCICKEQHSKHIYIYLTHAQFVYISFPQCNVYRDVQGGCLAFTHLYGYLNLLEFDKDGKFKAEI